MSQDRNSETLAALKTEIKALKEGCVNTCHVIENAPPEFPSDQMVDEEEVEHKIDTYVKGLDAAVHNSNTRIDTDSNLLTIQFLHEMKKKVVQVDELTAYTTGAIRDLDAEINRLNNLINVAQESQTKPVIGMNEVQPEHVRKAKDRFKMMKSEIHSLIESVFPNDTEDVKSVLGELMAVKLNNTSEEYIPIDPENYDVVRLLENTNIVTLNPYNKFEVKFNY